MTHRIHCELSDGTRMLKKYDTATRAEAVELATEEISSIFVDVVDDDDQPLTIKRIY